MPMRGDGVGEAVPDEEAQHDLPAGLRLRHGGEDPTAAGRSARSRARVPSPEALAAGSSSTSPSCHSRATAAGRSAMYCATIPRSTGDTFSNSRPIALRPRPSRVQRTLAVEDNHLARHRAGEAHLDGRPEREGERRHDEHPLLADLLAARLDLAPRRRQEHHRRDVGRAHELPAVRRRRDRARSGGPLRRHAGPCGARA